MKLGKDSSKVRNFQVIEQAFTIYLILKQDKQNTLKTKIKCYNYDMKLNVPLNKWTDEAKERIRPISVQGERIHHLDLPCRSRI